MPPGGDDEVGVYTRLLRLLALGHTRSPAEEGRQGSREAPTCPTGQGDRIPKEGGRSKLPTGPGRPSSASVRIPLHVHNRTLVGCRGTLCTGPRGQYSIGTSNHDSGTRVVATSSGSCHGGRALG